MWVCITAMFSATVWVKDCCNSTLFPIHCSLVIWGEVGGYWVPCSLNFRNEMASAGPRKEQEFPLKGEPPQSRTAFHRLQRAPEPSSRPEPRLQSHSWDQSPASSGPSVETSGECGAPLTLTGQAEEGVALHPH